MYDTLVCKVTPLHILQFLRKYLQSKFTVVQDNNITPHFPEDELGKNSLIYSDKYGINDLFDLMNINIYMNIH